MAAEAAGLFFRDKQQFNHFRYKLLPGLMDFARSGYRLRFCVLGDNLEGEAYSVALSILDLVPEAAGLDVLVLGIGHQQAQSRWIEKTLFEERDLKGVTDEQRAAWAMPVQDAGDVEGPLYIFDDAVRRLICFSKPASSPPIGGYYQAIFYRSAGSGEKADAEQARLWSRLMPFLAPGGALYTNRSDIILGPALRQLKIAGPAIYIRSQPGRDRF